jgi:hypothetical protein
MVAERVELKGLMEKVSSWQPRGYEDAGDGLEAFSDADLDAVPTEARKALARIADIGLDLTGRTLPQDKRDEGWDQINGFVAKEKACRADKKCMADRAARKAEEQFFATVVQPMCQADQERESALADMAHERANPSGYVNKVLLHDLGATVQAAQEQLAAMLPSYVKVRHHPWRGWRTECH